MTDFDKCSAAGVRVPLTAREEAKRARPPCDAEPWVVADDEGLRLKFETEDAAWHYRNEYTDRLVNPTVTHEPATSGVAGTDHQTFSRETPAKEL